MFDIQPLDKIIRISVKSQITSLVRIKIPPMLEAKIVDSVVQNPDESSSLISCKLNLL